MILYKANIYATTSLVNKQKAADTPESPGTFTSISTTYLELGEGNGNPLQYSCLENPMEGGAW